MENITTETSESIQLTDKEIFTQIWTSPRKVFKYIIESGYEKYSYNLIILAGIIRAFNNSMDKSLGDKIPLWGVIAISIVLGGLIGWIFFEAYAWGISKTGKWLKGISDKKGILRIMSYSIIPVIPTIFLIVIQILIYGNEMYKSDGDITSGGLTANILFYSSIVLQIVLSIWTLVLFVIGISEIQKFSIGKAILNILIPALIVMTTIFLLVMLIR